MKRLVSWFLVLVLISSVVLATGAETSLEAGQSKAYTFGPVEYEIKVAKIIDGSAIFVHNEERTGELREGESYKFTNGVSVAVDEFTSVGGERVRFALNIPTTECGRFRCLPGERCTEAGCEVWCGNGYCDEGEQAICKEDCDFCGNDRCDDDETCNTCEQDCACIGDLECIGDSCIKVEKDEYIVVGGVPVEEKGVFARFWDWLIGLFI